MDFSTERIKEYLPPVRIAESVECENLQTLLSPKDKQIYLATPADGDFFTLKKGGYIVLDFGKELHGGIRILNSAKESSVQIRFGESYSEACAALNCMNACNDHSTRDMNVFLPMLSDMEFGQTGFRFVRIDNVGKNDLKIVAIYAVYVHLKDLPIGEFTCSDDRVNEIYKTAAHTLFLCMQNRIWDGVKRDRLVWIGDMHPEVMGILSFYGAHPLIELSLKETAEHCPVEYWMNGLPSYSFWWIAIICDYEFYCDKWEFVSTLVDYTEKLLEKINGFVSADGTIEYGSPSLNFINWETYEESGLECANRGLLLWAVGKYTEMLKRHGKSSAVADVIKDKLIKNATFDGQSKAIAAIYSLGYGANGKVKEILSRGGSDGYSTFMSYYIASAVKNLESGKIALKQIKDFYGGMLDRGATSFWESFEEKWLDGSGRIDQPTKTDEKDLHSSFGKYCYEGYRLSLCHGWACGPVRFFTENALGVKFLEPGGAKIKIQPDLMGLKWAKGKVPTAFGLIEIENRATEKGIETVYKLPDGVTLVE